MPPTHKHTHTHTHTHTQSHTHTITHTHTYNHTHTHTYTHTHTQTHNHTYSQSDMWQEQIKTRLAEQFEAPLVHSTNLPSRNTPATHVHRTLPDGTQGVVCDTTEVHTHIHTYIHTCIREYIPRKPTLPNGKHAQSLRTCCA